MTMTLLLRLKKAIQMIKDIYLDLINRLDYHDWAALLAVLSMLATPFVIVAIQNALDKVKAFINKKLKPHGLRLKEHA